MSVQQNAMARWQPAEVTSPHLAPVSIIAAKSILYVRDGNRLQNLSLYHSCGGLADSVVNSALRFRAQAPLFDQLLREIGVQGGNLGRVAQGLLDLTQGSGGPPVPAHRWSKAR